MSTYARGAELAAALTAGGVRATADPRSAHPPCVLVTPPVRRYELSVGYSVEWRLVCLAPAPGTADSWAALDELVDAVAELVDVELAEPGSYTLPSAEGASLPAYILTVKETS